MAAANPPAGTRAGSPTCSCRAPGQGRSGRSPACRAPAWATLRRATSNRRPGPAVAPATADTGLAAHATGSRSARQRSFLVHRWPHTALLPPGTTVPGSITRGGRMARDLRVHAHVVERSRCDGGGDRSRLRAVPRLRVVITALSGRYRADDQPDQQDDHSESHMYLRKTGASRACGEPRIQVAPSSTPQAADMPADRDPEPAQAAYAARTPMRDTRGTAADPADLRCIVAGDGLGRTVDAARTRGARSPGRLAASAARRQLAASPGTGCHVLRLHHRPGGDPSRGAPLRHPGRAARTPRYRPRARGQRGGGQHRPTREVPGVAEDLVRQRRDRVPGSRRRAHHRSAGRPAQALPGREGRARALDRQRGLRPGRHAFGRDRDDDPAAHEAAQAEAALISPLVTPLADGCWVREEYLHRIRRGTTRAWNC